MSVAASCTCGSKFKVKDELAGKRVKCSSCGQPFTVPGRKAAAGAIRVACKCGRAFQAKPELAGKRVKCPACGQSFVVPAAPSAAVELCPSCTAPLSPQAVLCVTCGYHKSLGRRVGVVAGDQHAKQEQESLAVPSSHERWRKLLIPGAVAASLLGLLALVGLFVPLIGALLVLGVGSIALLVGAVGFIWLWAIAFQEDSLCGLLFFVPFYPLYYLISRWEDEPPFWLCLGSMVAKIALAVYHLACASTSAM